MSLLRPQSLRRRLLHLPEAAVVFLLYGFFRILPLDVASALGGWLGRVVGPRLAISRRARHNLTRAFPKMATTEIERIVRGMWNNLGRVAAEYPHLHKFSVYNGAGRIEVVGTENIDLLRDDGRPGIFFSAHLGNWEVISLAATQRSLPLDRVYRAANNPLVEWLYRHGRAAVEGTLIAKGPAGVRPLLNSLKEGRHLGMLVDQKMNDGIPVPFFGHDAMTAPALAEMALKFDCPVVPARIERLGGARFRLSILPPLKITHSGNRQADVAALMAQVNTIIEDWVRATPDQWLWLHNRWSD